jgi:anthranilate synthase component 1
LADELLSDEKEKAEHVMLVDLGRNDVGRVAQPGSVQVKELMTIERYSHVMHIVSHVEGLLREGQDAIDVMRATFPAGTLTGAPKIRAMEIIHELEPDPRGVYGGAVGYIGYTGDMDLAITIRTLEVTPGQVVVQAGAGIVYDSVPEREYEETCHKSEGMKRAVSMAMAASKRGS